MAKRKPKPATKMTDEELAKRLFPRKVLQELKRLAHEGEEEESKPTQSSQ